MKPISIKPFSYTSVAIAVLTLLFPTALTLSCYILSCAALVGVLGYNFIANTRGGLFEGGLSSRGVAARSKLTLANKDLSPVEACKFLAIACTAKGDLPKQLEPNTGLSGTARSLGRNLVDDLKRGQ